MSESLRAMFLILLFAGIMSMQYNMDADKTATRQVKNALELAVHDAALALDESQLSQGKIVFDQVQAMENLKKSLEDNLELSSGMGYVYTPTADSFYQDDFYLEHIEFVDDSNRTFPSVYYNPDYAIIDTLNGPSVIAVLSTTSPRYFAGDGITIRRTVVYEYFE
ncbi:peptidase M23 [Aquibacillus sp. 3ASR75-11]|uniref:Peptidase M23 n=1 Tax=Terrihalobacillus insolitus TaxID=2950438 RepID=A0A9X4ALE8_9BACI|nr:peptidase M23 [Terrihalobacillus insolitus]MDC3424312.1 peptidase M23 [Terrihalobacillus insolitus]